MVAAITGGRWKGAAAVGVGLALDEGDGAEAEGAEVDGVAVCGELVR